jgi:hypothetical protein
LETITQQIQVNAATALSKLKVHFDSWFYHDIPKSDTLDGFHDFCMFFFRQRSRKGFILESKQEYLDRVLRLWRAIYSNLEIHRGNMTSEKAVHATLIHCIDPGLRANITLGEAHEDYWIVFRISYDTWLTIQRQLIDKSSFDDCSQEIQWKWSFGSETRWNESESTRLLGSKFSNLLHKRLRNIDVRVKLQSFMYQIFWIYRGENPASVLFQLVHAYNPPLEIHDVIKMLKDGPSESQQHIALPKYLGGVLIDGSQSRIRIV